MSIRYCILLILCGTFFFACDKESTRVNTQAPAIVSIWPESGRPASIMTIIGYQFSPVPTENMVLIGDQEAVVLEASPTSLQVAIPEGEGSAKVTVTVNGSQLAGPSFTYTAPPKTYIVGTLAGSGLRGFADGAADQAQFYYPEGVALDASGALIVTDRSNHIVRKISNGAVATLAGVPEQSGYLDGPAAQSLFYYPYRPAIDKAGNIYIADRDNDVIRKIAPDGTVSTVAGDGQRGYQDGAAAQARFSQPIDVDVDAAGNLYVADNLNNCIRKITPDGTVETLAGSGTAGFADGSGDAAQFDHPSGLCVDAEGNVLVADRMNNRIRKITAEGEVSTLAGSGRAGMDDGPATYASFNGPYGVNTGPDGAVYVADLNNHKIRKIDTDGTVTTIAGSAAGFANGTGSAAQFNNPTDICVADDGTIYVADMSNNRIRTIREKK